MKLERICKPGSVSARPARSRTAGDHFSTTAVARGLQQPTRKEYRGGPPRAARCRTDTFLLGLAPGGVCRARPVTRPAGELLPHRFTLTAGRTRRRFAFCCTFPDLTAGGRYPPPCPAEPGLSSRRVTAASDRPIRSSSLSPTILIGRLLPLPGGLKGCPSLRSLHKGLASRRPAEKTRGPGASIRGR